MTWWNTKRSDNINPDNSAILYGYKPESKSFYALNHSLFIAKYHIFLARNQSESPSRKCLSHMSGNQSGAEKDNRLLIREQWILLFSKSKMADVFFSQSGAELRIQDGRAHESAAMLENSPLTSTEDWDRCHGFPW